ncbi:hypothetical protein PanWU01x14_016820, partial [Parasponia andersonii]
MGYPVWSDWSAFILGDQTMLYGTSTLMCSMVLSHGQMSSGKHSHYKSPFDGIEPEQ